MGADWGKLALIHACIGFEADVLGFLAFSNSEDTYLKDDVQAMLIIGFLLFLAGTFLMVLTKLGGMAANIIFTVLSVAAFIIAALFIFIGIGLYGDATNKFNDDMNAYASTLEITGAVVGLLAALFLLLNLFCGGKGGATSPSPS